tara:strand:- start:671 stop:916 length:246 start_codon:yes stop_codon:yes gene_type:complete
MGVESLEDGSGVIEMAYCFYHDEGDCKIELNLAFLEEEGWASIEPIQEILNQIDGHIRMWQATQSKVHDALNELKEKEMSE